MRDRVRFSPALGLGLLVAAILAGAIIAGVLVFQRTEQDVIAAQAERTSLSWARFVAATIDVEKIVRDGRPDAENAAFLGHLVTFGTVFRFKLFDPEGRLRLVSDTLGSDQDDGANLSSHNATAAGVLAGGQPHTEVYSGRGKPDRPEIYVESYVPVYRDGRMIAVAEVYVDQSDEARRYRNLFLGFGLKIGLIVAVLLSVPLALLLLAYRSLGQRNRALAEESARALEADRAKSDFLANMSHELRTPMNGVLGMAEILSRSALDEQQQDQVRTIQKSGRTLLRILNGVLDFAKLEAGRLKIRRERFDLEVAVRHVADLLRPTAIDKGLDLAFRYQPFLPTAFLGDEQRIQQVLLNLIGNAIKFTAEGHVLVDVSGEVDGTRVRIEIAVHDTGIGIPEDKQQTIFEKFNQVDTSQTRAHEGAGLGLSICKLLLDAMDGEITVQSRAGHGSVFRIRLDLERDEETGQAKAPEARPDSSTAAERTQAVVRARARTSGVSHKPEAGGAGPARQPGAPSGGVHVLLVEDNRANQKVLLTMIENMGHACTVSHSGEQALDLLEEGSFDIVLMDVAMPGMGGLEATRRIRAREAGGSRRLPVIALSAHVLDSIVEDCIEAGMDGHLAKPLSWDELAGAIARWTSAESGPAGADRGASDPHP